eukprot:c27122_g1_i1 orf=266-2389(-)
MGCSASKIESEESVARCRARIRLMKKAVQHSQAFDAAHAAYTQSLKNTGAAIQQFGAQATYSPAYVSPKSTHVFPPEPVLNPPFSPSTAFDLSPPQSPPPQTISITSPSLQKASASPDHNLIESPPRPAKEELDRDNSEQGTPPSSPPLELDGPPSPPPPDSSWDIFDVFTPQASFQMHEASTSDVREVDYERSDTKKIEGEKEPRDFKDEQMIEEDQYEPIIDDSISQKVSNITEDRSDPSTVEIIEKRELQLIVTPESTKGDEKDIVQVLKDCYDLFLVSFEAGREVSRMLEANKAHYDSNFEDSKWTVNHTNVFSMTSWARAAAGNLLTNEDANGSINIGGIETYASTLDKILAWEKKLYTELKARVITKIQLEKKSTQLMNQKERGIDFETIEKTRTLVQGLQTRYLVQFQAVYSAFLEIQKLRDNRLYPQLVDLIEGLSKMWKVILDCHRQQYQRVGDMKFVDNSSVFQQTTDSHQKNTMQLENQIILWHQHLERLISAQKVYVSSLHSWLHLNINQSEHEVKEKFSSPNKKGAPIYHLCRVWLQALDRLPGDVTLQSVKQFSSIIHETVMKQTEELRQKKRYYSLSKELEKKMQSLHFERKYKEKHMDEHDPDEQPEVVQGASWTASNPLQDSEASIDELRRKTEEEREKYDKLCLQSRKMSLFSLQKGLPPVLHAITEFASACSEAYAKLHAMTETGKLH